MNEMIRAEIVYPDGYIPLPYEPAHVRSLYELRNDFTTDTSTWMDDMLETLKEQELTSERRYEQVEDLRILQYRIDQLPEGNDLRSMLEGEMERLLDRYTREQLEADEKAEERFVEEVKRHYVASLHFLVDEKHQPIGDPDVLDAELLQESLLEGYQPAPYEKKEIRDIDELRDEYEDEYGYPIDEENWTKQMQDVVTEEVMPYSLVYDQMEQLRKIQYQIDKLDEDENLAAMEKPFDLPELEEDLLTPEELETAKRDQQYKTELNRRYEKKCQLVDDFESLADLMAEDQIRYQDQIDERMEE